MTFVLRMAVRETRASWRRLLFFFVCIAVGVAAIVALRSVIQSVREVFTGEARSFMAADVAIGTSREWSDAAKAAVDRRLAEVGATARTEVIDTPTMVRPVDGQPLVKMAELRAIQNTFPLYGAFKLQDNAPYSHTLLEHHGAIVRPELLTSLGVKPGDRIAIGVAIFTIRGVLLTEPGGNTGFSLGPRVLIDYADLPSTGLLSFGSRAGRSILVRVPEGQAEALARTLREDLKDQFAGARSFKGTEDQIGRDFDRAENYLSLVGLIIVILGGIAVSSVTRVFIQQKMRAIAVLKCVGARSGQVIAVYVLQVMALGLAGSVLGVGMARAAVGAIPLALGPTSTSVLAQVKYGVSVSAAVQGISIGVLVSLLFSIAPLLQVRFIKPSLLLRDETIRRRVDWLGIVVLVLVAGGLVAITAWQAASLRIGLIVCTGFAGLAVVLHFAGQGLVALVRPLANSPSFPLRHAVLHLSRPGNQTRVILLAVGLGAFFIVGVRSLQATLLDEFSVQTAADSPDMFLLDIQRNQADGVRAFLADPARGITQTQLIPVLRARVVGVDGRETHLEGFDDVRKRGANIGREFTITYRDHLEKNERIASGAFWTGPAAEDEVSIERGIEERSRIHVGDTMKFDVLGRIITARVTSVRNVEWRESRNGGFMFVFRPGATFDQAPQTFISPLKGPVDAAARARFQHDLVQQYPNVSVIDFHEVLERLRDVMSKVTLAITVVGALVLFSGALILVGAVAMTKFQRVYEAAVFKTLGANTRTIARMLLFEYGVLGSLAGTIGSVGAIALTWGVSRYALDVPWRVFPRENLGGIAVTAVLVAIIGVLSSLDVLRNKPLSTLRAE
jgi:putative ABC transport system permease protein